MRHIPRTVTYIGIALVSLFVICASLWYRRQYLQSVPSKTTATISSFSVRSHTIVEKTKEYDVDVSYPEFLPSTVAHDANSFLASLFKKRVDDFKKESIASLKDAPKELLERGVVAYYDVSFTEEASTTRYSSIIVASEYYAVGSAHPGHSIDTFIFDKKARRLVAPSELFVASSSYLELLSKLSRADFDARNTKSDADHIIIDTSSANTGFEPTKENFSKVLPLQDGLMIYFNEYQIAPYAAGPQQAVIPYSTLKDIINPDGILSDESRR
jgi:hypothetical protein